MTHLNMCNSENLFQSLGLKIPEQLIEETTHAYNKLKESLDGNITGFVCNRLQFSPEELSASLATEQIDGIALALYNIEAKGQSVVIGDQTGIGKGRQAAALIRYGILAGYIPVFLTDRYTLFSDMYRDCKAVGIEKARPLILNQRVAIVDFDKPLEDEANSDTDEIWMPGENNDDDEELTGIYSRHYEEVYRSPKKSELDLLYRKRDIPEGRFEYVMLTYSQLKDARKDRTRLDFLTSLCKKHRILFIFDEAHKGSSVSDGKVSVVTQCINSILETSPQTQCVFLSATFAKRPESLITFTGQTILSSLATNDTLQSAFSNGGVPMQEYVASKLAKEGQMIRREHSGTGIPDPVYTYLDDSFTLHSELFDKVMYWFREIVRLSTMVKELTTMASLLGVKVFSPYSTRSQLFYINKVLLLSLKAKDVAKAAIKEVKEGRSVVIGMSDTLECILRDSLDPETGKCGRGDFSTILLRILDKTFSNSKFPEEKVFDLDFSHVEDPDELLTKLEDVRSYAEQIRAGINEEIFHLPMSPIDVIRQLITQEKFKDPEGVTRNIRFEECTGRAKELEYLSPEGDDEYFNVTLKTRKKRHSNLIFNDFQNNKLDVILINACGAIGASAHAVNTVEVSESEVRQRKMLIVQNDLDVNIDLQKRGRINRTGQIQNLPPLYEYIITAIPSEKRLNMMLRAKLKSLSANTTANQDQDIRQADFLDITNKYGNLVTQEFLNANPELSFILGLGKTTTASQLLARIAMLSVSAQQELIDEIISAYRNKEEELRRINQWDLEREYRDFEAQFVSEEIFTAPIDDTVIGGESKISTFLCRHRTYPYDSKTLCREIDKATVEYGNNLYQSGKLINEIDRYYREEKKKIKSNFQQRKEKLYEITLNYFIKNGVESRLANNIISLYTHTNPKLKNILFGTGDESKENRLFNKLKSYKIEIQDLEKREKNNNKKLSEERKRLLEIISKAIIGQGYKNILYWLPIDEKINRVIAVLKEVRFGKIPQKKFLPGKIQFVFALSAVHKEIVLNLVPKGDQNNYERLLGILSSDKWKFNSNVWDTEIAKYNNRILERKIITGNILGAFSNPIIQKLNPRFITFSLAKDKNGISSIERGLLLPMSGENMEKIMTDVTVPLSEGLKFATAVNHIYRISGTGIDFSISPYLPKGKQELNFYIYINEKDSRKFESDARFDKIREYFKATQVTSIHNSTNSKSKQLLKYSTENLSSNSGEFNEIMSLLAALRASILIPRQYISVGEMRKLCINRNCDEKSYWPKLDWRVSSLLPPVRKELQIRISSPVLKDGNIKFVNEFPQFILLCQQTLGWHERSFHSVGSLPLIRDLYFKWLEFSNPETDLAEKQWHDIALKTSNELHKLLVNASRKPEIIFSDLVLGLLKGETNKYQLSSVGETIARYRNEYLFLSPPIEIAEKFLDSCLYDSRLDNIRKSLQDYISGKTEIIMDL